MRHWKFGALCVACVCTLFLTGCESKLEQTTVKINDQSWNVEIAKTSAERQQGLMNRTHLAAKNGMLFIFEQEEIHPFWMKDTLIPLDVIWISEGLEVVEVQTLEPCKKTVCSNFFPKKKAKFVLEVNAQNFQGKIGDKVEF